MTGRPPHGAAPGERLVRLAAHLVPLAERAAWRDEWRAELAHAWSMRARPGGAAAGLLRAGLTLRALGALPDALEMRRTHGGDAMLAHDVRFALRALARRPGFAALVALTLALGIGATTAVFTVVDGVLLRPLPYPDAERLVELGVRDEPTGYAAPYVAERTLAAWAAQPGLFGDVAHHRLRDVVLEAGEPRGLRAEEVSSSFFSLLGVPPRLGRTFAPEEFVADARVAVVSDDLWRTALGADPAAVGRTLTLSGARYTVIGVMPAVFRYPYSEVSLWLPLPRTGAAPDSTASGPVNAVARLAPGLDAAAAQRRADHLAPRLAAESSDGRTQYLALTPVGELRANPDVHRALLVLAGAVGCVMLIACGNAANLLLVRATASRRDLAVRVALGATRARVIRELLTEAVLLAAIGGLLGVLLAYWGVRGILAIVPDELVFLSHNPITMDARVLGFAVALSVLTVLLFGIVPALQATRRRAPLAGGDRTGTGTAEQRRLRSALVVGELALSVMLLAGAGLLAYSFAKLSRVEPGMNTRHLALVDISPSAERYPTLERRAAFYDQVFERIRALPGVRAVSLVSGVAGNSGGLSFGTRLEVEDAGAPVAEQPGILPHGYADTSYFRTLGIPIRQGRAFTAADMVQDANVAIIDEELARHLWADGRAVGRRFRVDPQWPWYTVVGVVGDVKLWGPDDRNGRFELYLPSPHGAGGYRTIAVRTASDPTPLLRSLKAAVYAVDPLQPVVGVTTAEQQYREPLVKPRFLLTLMAIFAVVAGALAAVGLYGVISYAVVQRTREIGIRMALGAQTRQIVGSMVGEGARLAVVGIAVGVAGALALSRFLAALLFDVSPTDPATLAAVALILGAVALLATWLPARRASRVDPLIAMRVE